MKIRIECDRLSHDRDWYGWAFADSRRIGVIWRDRAGYRFIEDFDRRKHSRENRPRSIGASTIDGLRKALAKEVW